MSKTYYEEKVYQRHTSHQPIISIMELTYHCNFDCVHCYADIRLTRKELELEDYKFIFQELRNFGILHLGFTGGEVFTKKNVFQILEEAKRQRFALRILTNGYFIDEEKVNFLTELQPTGIEISFYSHNEEIFEKISRKPGSYKKVLYAITELAKRGLTVYAKSPIFNLNINQLNETEKFVNELGCIPLYDPMLTPSDCNSSSPLAFRVKDEELLAYYQRVGTVPKNRSNDHLCSVGRSAFAISPYGDVFPCLQLKKSIGNIKSQTMNDIWDHSPFIKQLRNITYSTVPGCKECGMKSHCNQCIAVNLLENQDLLKKSDEHCRLANIRMNAYNNNKLNQIRIVN